MSDLAFKIRGGVILAYLLVGQLHGGHHAFFGGSISGKILENLCHLVGRKLVYAVFEVWLGHSG